MTAVTLTVNSFGVHWRLDCFGQMRAELAGGVLTANRGHVSLHRNLASLVVHLP